MKKNFLFILMIFSMTTIGMSQTKVMTPEQLIELNRVSAVGLTEDGARVVYRSSTYDLSTNERTTKVYSVSVNGGDRQMIEEVGDLVADNHVSPNGKWKLVAKDVKIQDVTGSDHYDDVPKSNVYIYDQLKYRHWDTWEDGAYSHIFLKSATDTADKGIDLMAGERFDCPQKPFGGGEDYIWSPDSKRVLYVTKKLYGTAYAVSTNSDIYEYNIATKQTKNLTATNKGYDNHPAFSSNGTLAWLQMRRDGYESDKNDIIVRLPHGDVNLTKDWDGTVNGFIWSNDGSKIYFNAPVGGTVQAFQIDVPVRGGVKSMPKQLSDGQFDVNGIIGQSDDRLIVYRRDMNHASEIYNLNIATGAMQQLTHENDAIYNDIKMSKIEKRMVKTTDGKDMFTWVIYPPDFDPKKKYPTLLYCQGGPQGALSQFYSFRWNFQLMAAHGYIVVAPNRRGMPGYGVEWNEQISKDYGGQNMQDYLSAIDDVAKEPYVDTDRMGCIGASYGGYSVFYLASRHDGRFKSFISHDGIFNWRSMYGTTEELFFVNWDIGGPYWDKSNAAAQRSYSEFNPVNFVDKWDTPILIIQGGKDFRVPIGQGLEAFQAAQLRGIKSKLLYFPEENHWVLSAQNSLVWQREFYKWLDETVKDVAVGESNREKYEKYVQQAWSLYETKDYKRASEMYKKAFDQLGGKAYETDRYNAACSYALADDVENSFYHLMYLAEHERLKYRELDHLLQDSDLTSLHVDSRWSGLVDLVRANKQEYEKDLDFPLMAKLDTIYDLDQKYRKQIGEIEQEFGRDSDEIKAHWQLINHTDSLNLIEIKNILDERGWLGPKVIGGKGNSALFLVIQHADLETQKKYLPMMREAAKVGHARSSSLALLEDRVALRSGERQIYGSQIGRDPDTGEFFVSPLIEPEKVNERRAEVGLGPIEEYIQNWDMTWDVEKHKKNTEKLEAEKED